MKDSLHQHFEMKDFGPLHYLLGLDVLVHDIGIYLQAKYPSNLISRAGLNDSKVSFTHFETKFRLTPNDGSLILNTILLRRLVGSLVYLIVARTSLYVIYSSTVTRFMAAPQTSHYSVDLKILRNIKCTMFHRLYSILHHLLSFIYFLMQYGDATD